MWTHSIHFPNLFWWGSQSLRSILSQHALGCVEGYSPDMWPVRYRVTTTFTPMVNWEFPNFAKCISLDCETKPNHANRSCKLCSYKGQSVCDDCEKNIITWWQQREKRHWNCAQKNLKINRFLSQRQSTLDNLLNPPVTMLLVWGVLESWQLDLL